MDKKNSSTPRKAHDINTQLKEKDLWDLEDDWDDSEEDKTNDEASSIPNKTEENEFVTRKDGTDTEEEITDEPASETSDPVLINDEFDLETEVIEELDDIGEINEADATIEDPEIGDTNQADASDEETDQQSSLPASEDQDEQGEEQTDDPQIGTEDTPKPTSNESDSIVEPFKKISLSSAEKIALAGIGLFFVALTIWGIMWLKGKNRDAVNTANLDLPVKGSYATISQFKTFWKPAGHAPGIKMGAVVVPAATISLGENSSSGALRIYFRNASKDSVGDPITVSFQDGEFSNGSETIEITATDGFHLKGDFHAYQMDKKLSWDVEVLEAEKDSASRAEHKLLFITPVEPKMQ